jgi:hypothetical protein
VVTAAAEGVAVIFISTENYLPSVSLAHGKLFAECATKKHLAQRALCRPNFCRVLFVEAYTRQSETACLMCV